MQASWTWHQSHQKKKDHGSICPIAIFLQVSLNIYKSEQSDL